MRKNVWARPAQQQTNSDIAGERGGKKKTSGGGTRTVESNGDEQNDKLLADGNAEGHSDEDAVEQDTDFEEHDLKNRLLQLLVLREEVLGREKLNVPAGRQALGVHPAVSSIRSPIRAARRQHAAG